MGTPVVSPGLNLSSSYGKEDKLSNISVEGAWQSLHRLKLFQFG